MAKERVGVVGPGRMGLAMVKHLIGAGYAVSATDIDAEQLGKAESVGAKPFPDAASMGAEIDYSIVAVGFDDETREVTIGEAGLLKSMTPGTIIAISSTASPDTVRMIDGLAREKGIDVFDAPTCRGRWAADEGTLLALVGGTDPVVERSRPIFGTFCSDIAHLGGVGYGQFGKAMNNYLMWISGLGLIEAGRLAEEFGADLVKLRDALLMSSGKSAALEDWDRMTFTWALKDMQIVGEVTDKLGLSLPIAGATRELVKEARRIKATNPPDWSGEGGIAKRP
jgi:3-hydroxyisobutyrate dehydrogenase